MKVENKKKDDSYLKSFGPVEVAVRSSSRDPRDDLEDAVREFRSLVTKERIMSVLKEHAAYEKPSDKKRRKTREHIRKMKKLAFSKTDDDFE
jgi:ribosomal protein S21